MSATLRAQRDIPPPYRRSGRAYRCCDQPERALPFLILAILVVQGGGSLILHVGLIDYIGYLILISAGAVVSFALALNYLMNVDELNPNRDALNHQSMGLS